MSDVRQARDKAQEQRRLGRQSVDPTQIPSYTGRMAASKSTWRIVKTSGGFGVQQRVGGAKVTKSTIVKPAGQYVRQQKGHSAILHWIFLGPFTLWIVPIYYSLSPNHYWHA